MAEIRANSLNGSLIWVAELCLRTGARWREAERLERKQLHNQSVTFVNTKSGKTRTIPLDRGFYADLLGVAGNRGANERVFRNCISAFRGAIARARVVLPRGQCTNICRHSFASHFMMGGGSLFVLREILGHSDIKMTMRYAHLAPEHLHDALKFNPFV